MCLSLYANNSWPKAVKRSVWDASSTQHPTVDRLSPHSDERTARDPRRKNDSTRRLGCASTASAEFLKTLINARLDQLDAEQIKRNALKRKVREAAGNAAKKIKLDVGGKVLCIVRSHLLNSEGFFLEMLESDRLEPDSEGCYFIDRKPKHFDRVLDYLRTGGMTFDGLRPDEIKTLQATLEYLSAAAAVP